MKHLYRFSWLMVAAAICFCVADASARKGREVKIGESTYKVYTDGYASFLGTDRTGDMSDMLKIPEKVEYDGNTYVVNAVADNAKNLTTFRSVAIPPTIGWLGEQDITTPEAKLENLYISDVEAFCKIDTQSYIFSSGKGMWGGGLINLYCNGAPLYSLEIPQSITKLTPIFSHCKNIKFVHLHQGIKNIPYCCFRHCTGLLYITGWEKVETIEDCAFEGCTSLKINTLPPMLDEIHTEAFKGCTSIREMSIPEYADVLWGYRLFVDCTSLKKIEVQSYQDMYVPGGFCQDCTSLTTVALGENMIGIGKNAFAGCTSLREIEYGNNFRGIDDEAVCCRAFSELRVPSSLESMYPRSYYDLNPSIEDIVYCDSPKELKFDLVGKIPLSEGLKRLYIGRDIAPTHINPEHKVYFEAPEGMGTLEYIAFGPEVKRVKDACYEGSYLAEKIVCLSEEPPYLDEDTEWFHRFYDTATLCVPAGTAEAYRNASGWRGFTKIVEGVSGIAECRPELGISVNGGCLTGLDGDEQVSVYTTDGTHIYTGKASGCPALNRSLYIIHTAAGTCKVLGR